MKTAQEGPWSCAVVGGNPLTAQCAQTLLDRGHRVEVLVTDDPVLAAWAEEREVPRVGHGPGLAAALGQRSFDYLFSVVNLRILPQEVLDLPRRAAVNYHDGPLPRHAGVHATSWALQEQQGEAGGYAVTWHLMTAQADMGDLLVQRAVPLEAEDTAYTLNAKCFEAALDSFTELVEGLERGTVHPRPQDLSQRSYHGAADPHPDGGVLVWSRPARRLRALVRAADFGPHPNAWGAARLLGPDEAVLVTAADTASGVAAGETGAAPGTVLGLDESSLTVATGEGTLRLTAFTDLEGAAVSAAQLAGRWNLGLGSVLPVPADELVATLGTHAGAARPHEGFWARRLGRPAPLDLPYRDPAAGEPAGWRELTVPVPAALTAELTADGSASAPALAAVFAFLARVGDGNRFDVALTLESPNADPSALDDLWAAEIPLRAPALAADTTFAAYRGAVAAEVAGVLRRGPHLRDLRARLPELRRADAPAPLPIGLVLGDAGKPAAETGRAACLHVAADGSAVTWFLDRRSFSAESAAGFAADLASFMESLSASEPTAETPLLTGDRRRLVLETWNETSSGPRATDCVTELIARQARLRPEAVAVADAESALTYRGLMHRTEQIARALAARGVGPGARVGVLMRRRAELVPVLLGVLASGAAYVPLDPVYPRLRLEYMIRDAGLALLVADAEVADGLAAGDEVRVLAPEALDRGEAEGAAVADAYDLARLDAPAYVIYTSGSTGNPKGVQVGHRALSNFLMTMAECPGLGADDVLLAVTTVCFDIAGLELYLPLTAGGRVVVAPQEAVSDGFALRGLAERTAPTVMQATPAGWRMLLGAGWEGDARLRVLCGGEALPADLAAQLDACVAETWNLYGPTETTIWSAVSRVSAGERITIGRPIAHTRFYVLDPHGEPVPPFVPGELYIAGDGVADGYLGRPELTAERFVPEPGRQGALMYRTGDIVRYLADGRLEYLHRADNQIKLHGYRIELGEIESLLAEHPSVSRCVAVVRQDPGLESRIVAYVVAAGRDRPPVDAAALRRHAAAALPHYMVPAAVVPLERIPLTDNGKVDRKALPAPARAASASRGPAPSSELERIVAAAWGAVVPSGAFGLDDNFFEVGGSSLTVVGMVAQLRAATGRPVTVVDVFRFPTIRTLAAHLGGAGAVKKVAGTAPDRGALLGRRGARARA